MKTFSLRGLASGQSLWTSARVGGYLVGNQFRRRGNAGAERQRAVSLNDELAELFPRRALVREQRVRFIFSSPDEARGPRRTPGKTQPLWWQGRIAECF